MNYIIELTATYKKFNIEKPENRRFRQFSKLDIAENRHIKKLKPEYLAQEFHTT